jgi:hypothetical protein
MVQYMFEKFDSAWRIDLAKAKMENVLNHFLYVLELHANNAFVVYSPILSSQIPASYAANAFNVFQKSMHQIEIIRLCALWDGAEEAKENIPTVIELINDVEIIRILADETRQSFATGNSLLLNPSSDPRLSAIEQQAVINSEIQFATEQASRAEADLKEAIRDSQNILASSRLASVMNLRYKHLAHSLTKTRRETRGPVTPMKYGDESALIDLTCPIIERLFCWVNGKSFSIEDSRAIDNKNAEALWHNCKFDNIQL